MSDTELKTIPRKTRVFSATYANLPTTGCKAEDLGYATDRKVLYRWSGAAWVALTIYSGSGTAANIPAVATLPEGSLYYETDTAKTKQVQGGAWVEISKSYTFATLSDIKVVRKTADESVNNSNVLQSDDHLLFAIAANEIWEVELIVVLTSPSVNSDFKYGWAYPAGCTAYWGVHTYGTGTPGNWCPVGTASNPQPILAIATSEAAGSLNGTQGFRIRAIFVNGATPGNINFQWAQNTATIENTTIKANSCLFARKLA